MESLLIAEKYTILHTCVNCKQKFRESENMGRLLCSMHPGLLLSDSTRRHYYSCCGLELESPLHCADTLGCLALDHVSTAEEATAEALLSTTSLQVRLDALCKFAVCILPAVLLQHGITRPVNSSFLYDSTSSSSSSSSRQRTEETTLTCTLDALVQTYRNHQRLIDDYNPYCERTRPTPAHVEQEYGSNRRRKTELTPEDMYAVDVNLRDVSDSVNTSVTAMLLNAKGRRSGDSSAAAPDGWASYREITGGGGANTTGLSRREAKKALNSNPFIAIKRIDDKLSIHTHYSRLG
jgi:hypothetical protein